MLNVPRYIKFLEKIINNEQMYIILLYSVDILEEGEVKQTLQELISAIGEMTFLLENAELIEDLPNNIVQDTVKDFGEGTTLDLVKRQLRVILLKGGINV